MNPSPVASLPTSTTRWWDARNLYAMTLPADLTAVDWSGVPITPETVGYHGAFRLDVSQGQFGPEAELILGPQTDLREVATQCITHLARYKTLGSTPPLSERLFQSLDSLTWVQKSDEPQAFPLITSVTDTAKQAVGYQDMCLEDNGLVLAPTAVMLTAALLLRVQKGYPVYYKIGKPDDAGNLIGPGLVRTSEGTLCINQDHEITVCYGPEISGPSPHLTCAGLRRKA